MFRQPQQQQQEKTKARQPTKRVTPSQMRSLMPPLPDEEDECFRWNQRKCCEAMEMEARQCRWETSYTVPDMDAYEASVLDAVFQRLGRWLRNESFDVRADSARPRSLIVSWDAIRTPDSITSEERSNQKSNAMIRLKSVHRASSRQNDTDADYVDYEPSPSPYPTSSANATAAATTGGGGRLAEYYRQQWPGTSAIAQQQPQPQQWLFSQWLESANMEATRMLQQRLQEAAQQQQLQQQQQQQEQQQKMAFVAVPPTGLLPVEATSRAARAADVAGVSLADAVRLMQQSKEDDKEQSPSDEEDDEENDNKESQQPQKPPLSPFSKERVATS